MTTTGGSFLDGLDRHVQRGAAAESDEVRRALGTEPGKLSLDALAVLLSPAAGHFLEELARAARVVSLRRFGKTIHLFAPLYLSNECVNQCDYCGFAVANRIARHTCSPDEVEAEARVLSDRGFHHILLVAAEHPKLISPSYLEECVRRTRAVVPSVSLEVQTWEEDTYRRLVGAGCEGIVVYQETYDRDVYARYHRHGPKVDYEFRLDAPERAARAGARRLGLGVLAGLAPWRADVVALAAHARYLTARHWRTEVTISLPRLRPAAGFAGPDSDFVMHDRDLVQTICALRLFLPDVGLVLSTREHPVLRDGLINLGVTHMSAGSRTEPGGYLHPDRAEKQFAIEDERAPDDVAEMLRHAGYDPVWTDPVPASLI